MRIDYSTDRIPISTTTDLATLPCPKNKEETYKGLIKLMVFGSEDQLSFIFMNVCVCVFVALRPMSTAMVIAGRSVHLTTPFPGQALASG